MNNTKICKDCKLEYPLNTDHFFKKKGTKDSFATKCKECQGYKFTRYLEIKDGEMCCKNCDKILPYTDEYFPIDKNTKTGLRNVCYECKGSSYGKRKEKSPFWTKEEDELLIKVYPNDLNKDILEMFPNRTEKALMDRARLLGVSKSEIAREIQYKRHSEIMKTNSAWLGRSLSNEQKLKLSNQMKVRWDNDYESMLGHLQFERTEETKLLMSEKARQRGAWKGTSNPRYINPLSGSSNGNWKGGITPLLFWLRNQLGEWKQESMKFHNYKCVLSGENFDEIHHLTSFKEIINIALDNLKYSKTKSLEQYSDDELEVLRDEILKVNNSFGLGVCLIKEIHKLFHDTYSYGNNTPEQFEEFSTRYKNGEFDEKLNKENKESIAN